MDEQRISVTPEEFERAMAVWLRVAPASIERRYARWLQLREEKRDGENDRVDLAREFAAVAAAKLVQAGWEITRRPSVNIFSDR